MNTYIGCKMVEAEPMTREAYNQLRGWELPKNENPEDQGYLVKYNDNYISWSPKDIFEKQHFMLLSDKQELLENLVYIDENDLYAFKGKCIHEKIDPLRTKDGYILGGTFEISDTTTTFDEWKEVCIEQDYVAEMIFLALLTFSINGFKKGNE